MRVEFLYVWVSQGDECRSCLQLLLLDSIPNYVGRTRLLATSAKESGAWLLAMPVTSLGLKVDDHKLRVAVWSETGYHPGGGSKCKMALRLA